MTAELGDYTADVLIDEAFGTATAAAAEGIVTEAGPVSEFSQETAIWRVDRLARGLVASMIAGTTAAGAWIGHWFTSTGHTPAPQPPRSIPGRTAPLITAVGPDTPTVPPGPLTGVLQVLRETITAMQQAITRHTAALARQMWLIVHEAIPAAIHQFDVIAAAPGYRMAHDLKTVAPRLARKARQAGMTDAATALNRIPADVPVTVASVLAVVAAATEGVTRIVDDCIVQDCIDKAAWKKTNDHLQDALGKLEGAGVSLAGLGLLKFAERDPGAAAKWWLDVGIKLFFGALEVGAAVQGPAALAETTALTGFLAETIYNPVGSANELVRLLLDP